MIQSKNLWINKGQYSDSVNELEKTDLLPITVKVLRNRGIDNINDMISFLNPDYSRLYNPFLLKDMDKAVNRILSALENKEKIIIYGDYDVDGITSTSILFLFLKENGAIVDYYIPNRMEEGYGLNLEAINKIKDKGTDLIITVDTGITAVNEVALAKELGMDVIITDHHECQAEVPQAYAVIDPKQEDCSYPFKLLAGVGVSFKLIQALAKKLNNENSICKYMDIVSVGTVADIVPLIDENRILVKKGFEDIPNTQNIGLDALLKVSGYKGGPVTTGLIGFALGPRLNASGRIGDAKRGIELLITNDKEKAKMIADELNEENKNRQAMEQEIFNEAISLIEKEFDIKNTKVIVIAGEGWHQGVIGIVASKIVEKYYRPTILLTIEDGIAKGSARSVEGFNIFEALCESSQFLTKFGGHEMAAGLTIAIENIKDFRIFINEYASNKMDEETLIPKLYLEDNIDVSEVSLELISQLKKMEPFGVGNPQPIFSLEAKVNSFSLLGKEKQHLKIILENSHKSLDAIGFGLGEYYDKLLQGQEIIAAGSLDINKWNNNIKAQLIIKDLKSSLEDELKYNYFISLYNLFLSLDDEATLLDYQSLKKISLDEIQNLEDSLILVQSLDSLLRLIRDFDNIKIMFNNESKICYTNKYDLNSKIEILVNPIMDKVNFSKYKTIVLYDSLWINKSFVVEEDKKEKFLKLKKTINNSNKDASLYIPERKDFVVLYRYLAMLSSLKQKSIAMASLIKESSKSVNTNVFKILLLLDIFMELGLIQYKYEDEKVFFNIISNKKTSLEDSKILQRIRKLNHYFIENQ
ncbi:MAG: single-stranded-DNA-specific exonuclease RecJ [Epulopiscium sp.]|nr:single-stranded-DNA-specific exonuclease RecJ [Candidatus Epulonipiscium sp.]